MRTAFESTVIDLPRSMLVQHPHLVHDAHVAVVVTEFTLACTRDTIRVLSWLKSNAPQARVIVVANRVVGATGQEISRKDFEGSIERKVDIVIPADHKAATQAAKHGQPLAKSAGSAKISGPLNQLLRTTIGVVENAAEGSDAAPGSAASLMDKLSGLTSIMNKKPKEKKAA